MPSRFAMLEIMAIVTTIATTPILQTLRTTETFESAAESRAASLGKPGGAEGAAIASR